MDCNKPNLFIIGASKCATTTVHDVLGNHENIFMSEPKELHYFSWPDYKKRLYWYLSHFEQAELSVKYLGESSPVYGITSKFPDVAKRIGEFNKKSKIIYIVRHPLTRLSSVWKQTLSTGHWYQDIFKQNFHVSNNLMPLEFEKAIFNYPSFLDECKYATNFSTFEKEFGSKNTLLMFYEDLLNEPKKFYLQIFEFLGLEPPIDEIFYRLIKNKGSEKRMRRPSFQRLPSSLQVFIRRITPPVIFKFIQTKKIQKPKFNPKLKEKVITELKDEISQILTLGNKPADFWKF